MRAVNGCPVGHVHRPDPDASTCCGDRSCLGRWEAGLTGESSLYVVDPKQRQDGDAVPLGNSVCRCGVPQRGQLGAGKLLVGKLGLLEAQDVGPDRCEPLEDAGHPRSERVDVPGCDSHAADGEGITLYTSTVVSWGGALGKPPSIRAGDGTIAAT